MKIVKWAAIVVTALMALMNLGILMAAADPKTDYSVVAIVGAVIIGLAGLAAAIGLGMGTGWGRNAVVAVGVINTIVAVVALIQSTEGAAIGLVVAALGAVLGWFSPRASAEPVTA